MKINMPLPHPGEVVKHDCLDEFGLNVTDAANVLGVTRNTRSGIINGRAGGAAADVIAYWERWSA